MYRRITVTICCLLCALLLVFPLAQPGLYALSSNAAVQGSTMVVSGQAAPGQWVSITAERADGKRCYLGQTSADSSGNYNVTFTLNQGTYQAVVSAGGQKVTTAQQAITENPPGGGSGGGAIIPQPDQATKQASISVTGDSSTGIILPATSWQWKGECTVLQALKGVLDNQGIKYQVRSGYVSSIGGLAEKKPGYPFSGWQYKQNGVFPSGGADSAMIHNGDQIEWIYTLEYEVPKPPNPLKPLDEQLSKPDDKTVQPKTEIKPIKADEIKEKAPDYSEVEKNYPWALPAFKSLYERGIITGSNQGFEPGRAITRAEMAALLQRCIKIETKQADVPLKDVSNSDWYYSAMQNAVKAGWIKGYPDKTLHPEARVTRYEAAGILYNARAAKSQVQAISGTGFTDYNQAPTWVRPALQYVNAEKLMNGYSDGSFKGQRQLRRAEAAVIIWEMLNHE